MQNVLKYLFGSEAASFRSPHSPHEAAARLASAVKRTAFHTFFREAVVGKSTVDRVRLFRYRPFLSNSFASYFTGSFQLRQGGTVLEGHFSMHWLTKAFMALWFGALLLGLLYSAVTVFSNPVEVQNMGRPIATMVIMLLFGIVLLVTGKWFARQDRDVIAQAIRTGINAIET